MKTIHCFAFATSIVILSTLISCKKDSVSSSNNDITETLRPVQTAVSTTVNANCSGFYKALPARYDSTTKKYPLLVFLHGSGEVGNGTTDLPKVLNNSIPNLIQNNKFPANFTNDHYSFIVISPQFKGWPTPDDVKTVINYAISNYRIDTTRIYVAGLSMGGGATWDFAGDYSSKVAAIVPISGASFAEEKRCANIASNKVAVWAFHNSGDKIVAPTVSKQFVEKINGNHAEPAAKLTIFESVDHDAWTKATDPNYKENGMNIYEWMLQYSKSSK